jgi:hypothetical protein
MDPLEAGPPWDAIGVHVTNSTRIASLSLRLWREGEGREGDGGAGLV